MTSLQRLLTIAVPITLAIQGTAGAGDLNPPPGTPASTMLRLDEMDSSTPIRSIPTTISDPGRYHLVGDFQVPTNASAIFIDVVSAGHVEVDLRGHTMTAPLGTVEPVIKISGRTISDITLKRGVIDGGTNGILLEAAPSSVAAADRGSSSEWKYVNVRRFFVKNTSGDGVHLAGDAEITLKFLQVSDTGGHGINICAPDPQRVDIEDASVALTFGDGIRAQRGALARYPLHTRRVDIREAGGSGIAILPPAGTTGDDGGAIIFTFDNPVILDAAVDGIHVADAGSSGWIEHALIHGAQSNGMHLIDNVRINEAQIFGAGANGIDAGLYIALSNSAVMHSGGVNVLMGDGAVMFNVASGGTALRNVEMGQNGQLRSCTLEDCDDALLAGRDTQISHSTVFGAISVGSYVRLESSVFIVDLDSPTYLPHNLTGGLHELGHCLFDAHGTNIANIPFLNISGDHVRIRNTKIMATDPQPVPMTSLNRSPPHFITWDSDYYDFHGCTVQNIWSGAEGIMINGGVGHVVRNNRFMGDGGAGAIGIIGATNGSMIIGNDFTGMGLNGTPIAVTGTNNTIPLPITGTAAATTNCSPDRNLWVP